MTEAELIVLLQTEVKGLTSYLETDDYTNAVADAERDTGWTMPVSTDFRIKWVKERAKRHLFFYLLSESAIKFQYKQIRLQHRFEHFQKMVDSMDKAFQGAIEEFAFEFAGVATSELFGHKVDSGFAYQGETGRDYTYDEDNLVMITPNESS